MLSMLKLPVVPPTIEKRTVELGGTSIVYTLRRTGRRRSIGLCIDDRGLTVNIPLRASENWLHSVLHEKASWVVKKLEHWQVKRVVSPGWRNGQISFFGDTLALCVVASLFETPPRRHDARLFVYVADATDETMIGKAVTQWYRSEATRVLEERVAHYAPMMNASPRAVKLSSACTQWGSCTSAGAVHLNWQLVKVPIRLIDYVVVHELAHLAEMNHSTRFWKVVEMIFPDYLERRNELKRWQIAPS